MTPTPGERGLLTTHELIVKAFNESANAHSVVPLGQTSGGSWVPFIVGDGGEIVVVGNVAHDAVDSGNPVKIGGFARDSAITPVAIGDRVNASFDTYGRLKVAPGGAGTSGNQAIQAGGASDSVSASFVVAYGQTYNLIFNGTSWERPRSVIAGASGLSTGLTASGLYQYNGSTWDAILKGQQTMASSVPVVVASDQSTLPVSIAAAPGVTATTISQGETSITTSAVLVASNANRKKLTVQNHGAANVRLSHSGTATTSSPIILVPRVGMFQLLPENGYIYQGDVAVISETGTNLVGFVEET